MEDQLQLDDEANAEIADRYYTGSSAHRVVAVGDLPTSSERSPLALRSGFRADTPFTVGLQCIPSLSDRATDTPPTQKNMIDADACCVCTSHGVRLLKEPDTFRSSTCAALKHRVVPRLVCSR